MTEVEPLEIWKKYHWVFFAYIQSLIICLLQFEMHIKANNLAEAEIELETATKLI